MCVSLCVAALWGGGLLDSLCEVFLLKSPAGASVPPQWWAALLLVLGAGAGAAYAVERAGARRAALFVGCAGAAACVASLAASKLLQLDVVFAPTMLAASLSLFAAQARRLWEIDAALTRSVQRVASRPSALEGRGANARLMCGLKLLATVLPLDEAVIFRLDAAGLPEQAARLRTESNGAAAALPGSPEPDRNDAWREGVALCERAVRSRSLATREGAAGTAVALPLEHDGAAVGALLLRLRGGFDETDRPLLANVSAQFARDLQRDEARSLDVPQPPQTFASTRAARQRLESVGVLSGLLTEQGFAAHALSEARDAHAVAYLDGTLACVNPRMLEAARVSAAECRALDLFGLLERFRAGVFDEPSIAVRRVLQTGQPYEREITYIDRGRTLALRIALVTAAGAAVEAANGAGPVPLCLSVTAGDVTEAKEHEKLRSDMLSLMSHEMRTPITSINGFAELLAADERIPAESREFLSIIQSESQRLTRMINTFLSVSRLEQKDRQEVTMTAVMLDDVMREAMGSLHAAARRKRIRLVERDGAKLPPVAADRALITQAVANLVENAIKYSPERTAVTLSTELEADSVRLTVEDRGYGIPPEDQPRVWEKFYRVARDGHAKEEESTGLGLSFVREVVEQHGGQVSLESEVGRGSKFSFTLPRL